MTQRMWHVHTPPVEAGFAPDYWWLQAQCGCIWRRGDESGQWWIDWRRVRRGVTCESIPADHRPSDIETALYTPCPQCPRNIGSRFRTIPHPLDPPRPPAPPPRRPNRLWEGTKTTLLIVGGLAMSYFVFTSCGGSGISGWGP